MKLLRLSVLAVLLAPVCAVAQSTKVWPVGGGIGVNSKIPVNFNAAQFNKQFVRQMDEFRARQAAQKAGVPAAALQETESAPAVTNAASADDQNYTRDIISREKILKSNAYQVTPKRDWYVEKHSAAACEFFKGWLETEDTSFLNAADKRIDCEEKMDKKYETHTCAICGRKINPACGAVSTWDDAAGKKQYAHADCFDGRRHMGAKITLQKNLAITDDDCTRFARQKQAGAEAQKQAISEMQATMEQLKKAEVPAAAPISKPAPAAEAAKPVVVKGVATDRQISSFVEKNRDTLRTISQKKKSGVALSDKETEIAARFEAMRQSRTNNTPYAAPAAAKKEVAATAKKDAPRVKKQKAVKPAKPAAAKKTAVAPKANSFEKILRPAASAVPAVTVAPAEVKPVSAPAAATPVASAAKPTAKPVAKSTSIPAASLGDMASAEGIVGKNFKDNGRADSAIVPMANLPTQAATPSDQDMTPFQRYTKMNRPQIQAALTAERNGLPLTDEQNKVLLRYRAMQESAKNGTPYVDPVREQYKKDTAALKELSKFRKNNKKQMAAIMSVAEGEATQDADLRAKADQYKQLLEKSGMVAPTQKPAAAAPKAATKPAQETAEPLRVTQNELPSMWVSKGDLKSFERRKDFELIKAAANAEQLSDDPDLNLAVREYRALQQDLEKTNALKERGIGKQQYESFRATLEAARRGGK